MLANLDCMTIDELKEVRRNSQLLDRYANYKMQAIRHRENGNIQKALDNEKHCDRIYEKLPADLRW